MPDPPRAPAEDALATKLGAWGAITSAIGIVVSGPFAVLLVDALQPQPPWRDPELFIAHYHPLQALPYFAGFLLIFGYVALIASLHATAARRHDALTSCALVFVAIYAALEVSNYVMQAVFLPFLATHATVDAGPIIAAATMVNPTSYAWGIEMFAYALLGVATWLVAPVFAGSRIERATAHLFVANGVLSVLGAVWTAVRPGWVLTTFGLLMFVLWNAVALAMSVLAAIALRRRLA
jgi:hypothetical protein